MFLRESKILKRNLSTIKENVSQAKQYVTQNKLSPDQLKRLIELDPSSTRKYVGWMAKQLINNTVTDLDELRNTIEEFNTFLDRGKTKTKDINQFKTFSDLKQEVDNINKSGEGVSVKSLESDSETIIDNDKMLVMVPHTHEASRKLGLSHFSYRNCDDGSKDSAWCTTYKAPDHFNDYYYSKNVTFYYIKVRSSQLIEQLKKSFPTRWKDMVVVALAVLDDGKIDGYDGLDKQISAADIKKFTNILGIS
jgi:hypothetical protein